MIPGELDIDLDESEGEWPCRAREEINVQYNALSVPDTAVIGDDCMVVSVDHFHFVGHYTVILIF